jgi:hypothetical protein
MGERTPARSAFEVPSPVGRVAATSTAADAHDERQLSAEELGEGLSTSEPTSRSARADCPRLASPAAERTPLRLSVVLGDRRPR